MAEPLGPDCDDYAAELIRQQESFVAAFIEGGVEAAERFAAENGRWVGVVFDQYASDLQRGWA